MNKNILFVIGLGATVLFTACNKNMKSLDASYFKTVPNPLETKGGKVDATVTGTFPQKYFVKNAVLTVTPVLKYGDQELKGNPAVFQGEKVLGNNQTVNYKTGGTFSINPSYYYDPAMAKSDLVLNFNVTQKKKSYTLPSVKVADGVLATSELVSLSPNEIRPALAPDSFKYITQEKNEADILFLIQQAKLRNSELNKNDVKIFNEKVKEARQSQNKDITSLQVSSYASPDGPMTLNQNLAENREKVTMDYLNKELKKLKANVTIDSKFTAEDWDGFQKLMEASNIQDKDLILRVLSMYQDPEQREREIKNLSSTFELIAKEILPQLRRSKLMLAVDVKGKTDGQILALATSKPDSLTANELLYAGTLAPTNQIQTQIYTKFIDLFPNDARGYNNLGLMRYYNGEIDGAENLFKKALEINPNLPDANYNMGLVKLTKGQLTDAQAYFGKSAGTVGNINAALGASYIKQGDYTKALNVLKDEKSNNAALVQILTNDYNGARSTLSSINYPNELTFYLNAILAARTNDRDGVYSNLSKAVQKDVSLAKKASTDLEFAKYFTDSQFLSILK